MSQTDQDSKQVGDNKSSQERQAGPATTVGDDDATRGTTPEIGQVLESAGDASAPLVLAEFDKLTEWYARKAWQARQWHFAVGVLLILTGASVSVVALSLPDQGVLVAALGAAVVVLTGVRSLFHWQENWFRFTGACQALKQERRKYIVGDPPYEDPATRHRELVKVMNGIESKETQAWLQLVDTRTPESSEDVPPAV